MKDGFGMKRLLSLIFVVLLCSCFAIPASAADLNVDEAYAFATELLSEYYYAKDQAADYDFTRFTDNSRFLEFLNKKTESAQYRTLLYGVDEMHDYDLSFLLKNAEFGDDYVIFNICATAKYLYRDALGAYSSVSDLHYVFVSKKDDEYVILDWGEQGWWCYEITLRGEIWSAPAPYYWETMTMSDEDFSAILDKRTEWIKESLLNLYRQTQAISISANNTSSAHNSVGKTRPFPAVSDRHSRPSCTCISVQVLG